MRSNLSPRTLGVAAVVVLSMLAACGDDDDGSADDTTTTTTAPADDPDAISGSFDVGGHELAIECAGAGSPTVIVEPGEGGDGATFASMQDVLSERTRVCTYDRAGIGASDGARTPRTSDDVVDDLRALLDEAGVDGPYVLVGTSAGANFSLHHARRHPDDVAGVLAMNPVPLASQWVARAYPLFDEAEVAAEKAYYAGENGESLDYTASSEQHEALAAPEGVPLILLHSDITQCEGFTTGPCGKSSDLYLELGEEYAAAWPGARFEAVASVHDIFAAEEEMVLALINELLDA